MLLNSPEEFRQFAPIQYGFAWALLRPHLETVERTHLKPLLGQALLDDLHAAAEASGSGSGSGTGSDALADALRLAREATAMLTCVELVPFLSVQIGETGLRTVWDENHRAPFQWQVGDLQDSLQARGMRALDALLETLEAAAADLASWKESPARTALNGLLVRTVAEFETGYAIGNSRTTLWDLRPAMVRAQRFEVGRRIGQPFLAEVLAHLNATATSGSGSGSGAAEPTTEQWAELLGYLRAGLACFTIAQAHDVQLQLVDGGLVSTRRQRNAASKDTNGGGHDATMARGRQAHTTGEAWLATAAEFLDANADVFPTWADSDLHTADRTEEPDPTTRLHNAGGFVGT